MSKTGHYILLIALLLMPGIKTLQAASVLVNAAADSHCMMQQDSGSTMAELSVQNNSDACQHCQDSSCNSNECSMPSCPMYQGQVFSVISNNLLTAGLASGTILLQPEAKIRSRNDPPLIRPPITLVS